MVLIPACTILLNELVRDIYKLAQVLVQYAYYGIAAIANSKKVLRVLIINHYNQVNVLYLIW